MISSGDAGGGGAIGEVPHVGGQRWAARLWRVVPPLGAFLLARALLGAAGAVAGVSPLDAGAWVHWDSKLYMDIAVRGYELIPCDDVPTLPCGNAGWLPGLPYAMRPLIALGLDPSAAGAIVAALFALGFLAVVWSGLLREERSASSLIALASAALAPGAVYLHAVFPSSMTVFFAALQACFLERRRWIPAALAGAAAAFSYSTGFLLAGVAGATILLMNDLAWRRRVLLSIAIGVATFAGFAALLVIQQLQLGVWNAFFMVQAKYGHGVHDPFGTLFAYLRARDPGSGVLDLVRIHVLVSLGFVLLVLAGAAISVRRGGPIADRWAALHVLTFLLVPFAFGPAVNPVRSIALLAPSAITLRWLPRPVVLVCLAASAAVVALMAVLFFRDLIV